MKTGSADKDLAQQALKLTLAGVIGQVGCLTLVIIGIALGAGLWLDSQFQTRPIITLALVIASVPAEQSVGASDEITEEEPEGGTGRGNPSET
jgi:hypothetical protein